MTARPPSVRPAGGGADLDLFRQALPSVAPRLALTPAAVEEATHSDEALLALGLRWVAAELGISEIYLQRSVRGL